MFRAFRRIVERIVAPLRADPDETRRRLSIPESGTTTLDGDVGWGSRPPASLRCPRCGSDVVQGHPYDEIDCPRCAAAHSYEDFPDLDLQSLLCPTCGTEMEHGRRHPNAVDVPEWATCHACRYHWEFKHDY